MTRAVLSIGSNLGDRLAHLQSVVDALGADVVAVSPVYQTAPWGSVPQSDFLNAIVIAQGREPREWLTLAHLLEQSAQRVRGERWGPRTLDVDVISCRPGVVGDVTTAEVLSDDAELTLPHPRAHQRAFVLVPWLALEPEAVLTVEGRLRPVADLVAGLAPAEREGVRRVDDTLTGPVT
ncbi:2-amino-4-hydroxy-6-hydroxymethyldihydropteridine diphosphokinase [Mycobacteroides salmoniphilum]|uniref:2-amino-4-hydroxy-6-hydroxymethyldihydropteridine diphosphokinase n=1 Tax=Mycobacteroides salmoniphilum TaxID=404941 RepID=A0A4R8SLX5_9MYCO|nr:2-amino-4-hydroxy-6-hydroxymethyldihydropteridine diphosphokinase [Mycobacteroides salmoniphilum]TDZ98632.1 2-amino-4-hydroxy-6-hydroxymethyldihydropteridine pyrophosphokinase [Mycobacteroides salmoniphilum]TEA03162.1 2-amino-4-hydroxy-6-hydroxymethyldihydropteridine pyrophosphokinase [Mycobacteroides salmoniphilum]